MLSEFCFGVSSTMFLSSYSSRVDFSSYFVSSAVFSTTSDSPFTSDSIGSELFFLTSTLVWWASVAISKVLSSSNSASSIFLRGS